MVGRGTSSGYGRFTCTEPLQRFAHGDRLGLGDLGLSVAGVDATECCSDGERDQNGCGTGVYQNARLAGADEGSSSESTTVTFVRSDLVD